jgi:hypothetical protein
MAGNWKKTVLIGVAVVAVIAGVVIAVTSGSSHKKSHKGAHARVALGGGTSAARADVATAAGYTGLTQSKLRKELRKGRSLAALAVASHHSVAGLVEAMVRERIRRIEAQVAAGTVSRAAATRRIARIRARVAARVAHSADFMPTLAVAVAAKYLGLSSAKLRAELRRGRSMAKLANATAGKSAEGLVKAVLGVRERELTRGAGTPAAPSLSGAKPLVEALEARARTEVQRAPLAPVAQR